MSGWETSAVYHTQAAPEAIWNAAYAEPAAWAYWNPEIRMVSPDGPVRAGARFRLRFRNGFSLRFTVTEFEAGRMFTDEARLLGARMGHRHLVEPSASGGARLTNTIYLCGPLAGLWRRVVGRRAARSLPVSQRCIVELALGPLPRPASSRTR